MTDISTGLEAGETKVNISADSVPGKGSLPGLQKAAFLWYPRKVERERAPVSSPSFQDIKSHHKGFIAHDLI